MIEQMRKTYCVARAADRDRLLGAIRDLGVVHLAPVDPARAVPGEETTAEIERLTRALQIVGSVTPAGEAPTLTGGEAAGEVVKIQRDGAERRSRLASLHRQIEQLARWGDVTVEQFEALKRSGIEVKFYIVADEEVATIHAECIEVVGTPTKGRSIVAIIDRTGSFMVPEGAEEIPLPTTDRPSIRAEAAEIDKALKRNADGLAELAHLTGRIEAERAQLRERASYNVARGGALAGDDLFAVQGWIPARKAAGLSSGLSEAGVEAAVEITEPVEDELPPTLIRYPKWTKPIKGLFDILATVPGYREIDLSDFFMVAMPLFAAILIGDAGYGLVFLLAGVLMYKKAAAAAGASKVQLLIVMGMVTVIWGMVTGGFFGLGPIDLCRSDALRDLGYAWNRICFVGVSTADIEAAVASGEMKQLDSLSKAAMDDLRQKLIAVSFIIAVVHLALARLREAVALAPDQRALASLGWAAVLAGIFDVVWFLFFGTFVLGVALPCIGVGWGAAVLFSAPHKNPIKRLALGLASCLLPIMDCFSNTMSYIRLMAVSLASVYIAQVFNMLGSQLAGAATWFAAAPVVVFGHALNIGLCMIAIFAHGVRLNMLEFSSNAGVQWGGYPFQPFAKSTQKET